MHLIDAPDTPSADATDFDTFRQIDIRVGTVLTAEKIEGLRNPALRLEIDFGPGVGTKKSLAQITVHYDPAGLVGKQVAAVVNFPPRQISKYMSEVLTLGFADTAGAIVLFSPDQSVPNGARLA